MEKFLFNINSTSWFHTLESGKVVKLEVFLLLMSAASFLGAIGVGYEGVNDIDFGTFSLVMVSPFVILIAQYLLYANIVKSVSKDIQDYFWKTQLWRFKDPNFAFQMSLYPNWKFRLQELEQKWLEHYGETANETLRNAPGIQEARFLVLLGSAFAGLVFGMLIGLV